MKKDYSSIKGFTLIELLIVISIIAVLTVIVVTTLTSIRSSNRDSQSRIDKQQIILALVKEREKSSTFAYPGIAGSWQCVKASGTCWLSPSYSGNATIANALSPYFPNGIPVPPGAKAGEHRDAYLLYSSTVTIGTYTGSFLIWFQEKPISDCNGYYPGAVDTGVYACYELLPR